METKAEMSIMAEQGKTWSQLKQITQDESQWQKYVCAYAPQVAKGGRSDAHYMGWSINYQNTLVSSPKRAAVKQRLVRSSAGLVILCQNPIRGRDYLKTKPGFQFYSALNGYQEVFREVQVVSVVVITSGNVQGSIIDQRGSDYIRKCSGMYKWSPWQ